MSRTVSAPNPSMTSWMPLAKNLSSTAPSFVSRASRPSLRARFAYSTTRSISSVGDGDFRIAETIITLITGFRSWPGNANMVTAIVPPNTITSDGMWMNTGIPPGPTAMAKSTRAALRVAPMTVFRSMGKSLPGGPRKGGTGESHRPPGQPA